MRVHGGQSGAKHGASRPRRPRWVLIALLLSSWASPAQTAKATEADVKAAYLYNFGKFVKWPRPAGDAFSICVLGRDPFGELLDATVSGEKIDGKPVVARRISRADEAGSCQVLFIAKTESSDLKKALEGASKGVLTVSDMRGFAQHGGMIEFVNEENRIRFEVNLAAAEKAGLTLSSELLKVASTVRRSSGGF